MMRARSLFIALGLTIASCGLLHAQKPAERSEPGISMKDLSRLDVSKMQEHAGTALAGTEDWAYTPFDVVVQFLQLNTAQAEQLQQLLMARQKALGPLLQQIEQLNKQLQALLDSGGPAPAVGQTVIEIHQLQVQATQEQQSFLGQFQNLLDDDQRQRLEAVGLAAKLQPVLPAFQQLQLL